MESRCKGSQVGRFCQDPEVKARQSDWDTVSGAGAHVQGLAGHGQPLHFIPYVTGSHWRELGRGGGSWVALFTLTLIRKWRSDCHVENGAERDKKAEDNRKALGVVCAGEKVAACPAVVAGGMGVGNVCSR